jgi:hypothetical protein
VAALDDELIDREIYELAHTAHRDQMIAARVSTLAKGDNG